MSKTSTPGATPTSPTGVSTPLSSSINSLGEPEGFSALLFGESGTGKTWALISLIEAGLDLFVLGTEPRFRESLMAAVLAKKLDPRKLHTCHVYPTTDTWEAMIENTETIAKLNYEQLTKIKSGIGKEKFGQFVNVYRKLMNFVDDATGESFGPVDKFGPDRAVAIDSTTGLAYMSMDLIVGAKPVRHEGEWGVAMDNLEKFNNKCTSDIRCFFVMTGHVEREPDPLGGGSLAYIATLGKKLSPKWGRFYSEVILTYREGREFWWSTDTPMYATKQRSLPISNKIRPTFIPLVEQWHKSKGYNQ